MLWSPRAQFELARRLQSGEQPPLWEVFSFLSGLYFRGKIVYARKFAAPPPGMSGVFVITPNRGLIPADSPVALRDLRSFARVPIEPDEPRYLRPLRRTVHELAARTPADCRMVLLGSISTPKYVEPLSLYLSERLHFPSDFVGRGDMSRGGLLLRSAASAKELVYEPVLGKLRKGKRPPKLAPKSWGFHLLSGHTKAGDSTAAG